jgi:HEAT repeat protein
MKNLRARSWLLGMIAVLLSFIYLIFWTQPPGGWASRNPPSMSALMRALQRKDSRLNTFEVALWGRLPIFVQSHSQSLRPRLAVETRLNACTRLGRLGAQATDAVPCLIKALDDPDIMVRYGAIQAIRRIGPSSARGAKARLLAILHDPAYRNPANRFVTAGEMPLVAALTLAAIAPRDPDVGSALLDLIAHPGPVGWPPDIAREWIGCMPEALSVFESLRKILPQKDSWDLVQGVARSYADARKRRAVLLSLAEDPDYGIRCHAVHELGALGPSAAGAVPKLMELFSATEREWEDPPEDAHRARFEAYTAFVSVMAPRGPFKARYDAVRVPKTPITAAPGTPASAGSTNAAALGPAAPVVTAVAPLAPGFSATAGAPTTRLRFGGGSQPPTDPIPGFNALHHQVILALGEIGPRARDAIPLLVREYQDPTNPLRFEAAVARVRVDGNFPEVMPLLAAGLEQAGPELRARLLSRIAQLAGTYDGAVTLLIKALADPAPKIRLQAFQSLGDLGGKAAPALPAFIAALDEPEADIRLQAIKNLGALGSAAAPVVPALVKALGDPERRVRSQAVLSLVALGDKAVPALPALREMASDSSFSVRIMASNAVKRIESAAHPSPGGQASGAKR